MSNPPDRMTRVQAVLARTGVSSFTLYDQIEDSCFTKASSPHPIHFGESLSGSRARKASIPICDDLADWRNVMRHPELLPAHQMPSASTCSDPDVIAFAEALARVNVTRDIAAARAKREVIGADRHLRPLQQR